MAKTSRFRFAKGQAAKPDSHFMNTMPSNAIWDCGNFLAANQHFIAVPYHSTGSTAVFRHDQHGKLPTAVPVLQGHQGAVIELQFDPFDEYKLFTGSEDGTIRGWNIPETGLANNDVPSVVQLNGHTKKVGILSFHPSARGVLASAGMDNTIHIWDVETQKSKFTHKGAQDWIFSLNWNLDGSLLNMTTRDKKVSILDSRTGSIVASTTSHQGSKCQRSIWAKRKNVIVTLGFDKNQHRQAMVFDARNLTTPLHAELIDQASSIMIPMYDEDTGILYIGSKGDGSIRYFELCDEAPQLLNSNTFMSSDSTKGLCMMPKSCMDVKQCEIARFYVLGSKSLYPVRMILPRRQAEHEFQEDVFVPTFASEPALTAEQYFSGSNSEPKLADLRGLFDGTGISSSSAFSSPSSPVTKTPTEKPAAAAAAPVEEAKKEEEPAPPTAEVTQPTESKAETEEAPSKADALRNDVASLRKQVEELRESLSKAETDLANKEKELEALEATA